MENRDYLMAQIEQVGKTMAAAVSRILGSKNAFTEETSTEVANQLIEQLDCDLFELLSLSKEDKIDWFKAHELAFENAEGVAYYFIGLFQMKAKNGISCLKAAKDLLVITDQQTKSFSMARAHKMMEIDQQLVNF
jgi:hypothetical protein